MASLPRAGPPDVPPTRDRDTRSFPISATGLERNARKVASQGHRHPRQPVDVTARWVGGLLAAGACLSCAGADLLQSAGPAKGQVFVEGDAGGPDGLPPARRAGPGGPRLEDRFGGRLLCRMQAEGIPCRCQALA